MSGDETRIIKEARTEGEDGRPTICCRLTCRLREGRPSYALSCEAEGGALWESRAEISDLTSDRETAERIFSAVVKGEVTPYGLIETVTELLG